MPRYLNWTISLRLVYKRTTHDKKTIEGYLDAKYVRNVDTRKFIFWYVFTLFGIAIVRIDDLKQEGGKLFFKKIFTEVEVILKIMIKSIDWDIN